MKILTTRLEEKSLVELTARASKMLLEGDFERLAAEFGYAVSLGRNPATAIQEDLFTALAELGVKHLAVGQEPHVCIRMLPPGSELCAVIESRLATPCEQRVLLEIVVSESVGNYYATLEQISAAA